MYLDIYINIYIEIYYIILQLEIKFSEFYKLYI